MKKFFIDEINKNIIKALLTDGRKSFSNMAIENDITTSSVKSRYENLKKSGVINGAIILMNPEKIGINCYGFLGFKVNPEKKHELKEFLNKQPFCLATWYRLQEINLGCFFALPDFKELTKILDQLKTIYYIKQIQPLINAGTPVDEHPENLIIPNPFEIIQRPLFKKNYFLNLEEETRTASTKKYIETFELQQMKDEHRQITKLLSMNARKSFTLIGKQTNMSTANVSRIFKNLKKRKILLTSSITVNLKKLGYQANLMIFIKISPGSNIDIIKKNILEQKNVIALNKTMGDWDIFATIPITSFDDYFKIADQFRKINGIKKMQFDINPPFSRWPAHLFHHLL